MRFDHSLWAHVGIGSLAMILFWATLLSVKGSLRHRRRGRTFFVSLLATVSTVPPIVLLRPVPFDPGWIVSLVYLSVCVGTVVTLAWTAIRWKDQPERFRGTHFRVLGPLLVILGVVVLVAGLAKGDPVAAVLSWVGLAYGAAMIHFAWSRAPMHARWWLSWHVSAVLGLFTAVHGTLCFVVWRALLAPDATRADAAAWHFGVLVVALVMRAGVGRQRGLPWGFFERTARPMQVPVAGRQP
jgi:energy-converting hydrogenase Eha subunit E